MQIRSITVNNFKSLVDFKLDLAKFTCLIGLNGSGKSTVLQFIDFLSQLMRGDMKGWLAERKWRSNELKSQFTKSRKIDFEIEFAKRGKRIATWQGSYTPAIGRCLREVIVSERTLLNSSGGFIETYNVKTNCSAKSAVNFDYDGSILSALKETLLHPTVVEVKRFLLSSESLDTLTPDQLRQRTKAANGSLGHGGKNLAAFLNELYILKRVDLIKKLKAIYPRLRLVTTRSSRGGLKQLIVTEDYAKTRLRTHARHLNDGMLRILAIFAEMSSDHQFLLFDEIENGINPEIVEFVIDALVEAKQQVLVTTHSPMILNYLNDDVAKPGVMYLYKTPQGHTQAVPFFEIPSLAEKLTVMGPGEAFVDTNLTELADEIDAMPAKEA
ncbi:MAG: AAA family ATPase [Planctomycetaceae bacterium]